MGSYIFCRCGNRWHIRIWRDCRRRSGNCTGTICYIYRAVHSCRRYARFKRQTAHLGERFIKSPREYHSLSLRGLVPFKTNEERLVMVNSNFYRLSLLCIASRHSPQDLISTIPWKLSVLLSTRDTQQHTITTRIL